MYDTVKGSDYIGDQDAIEYMCKTGPKLFLGWSIWDFLSLVLMSGRIIPTPIWWSVEKFLVVANKAARTAAAADRTGHALLHTLYQQKFKNHTTIFLNGIRWI